MRTYPFNYKTLDCPFPLTRPSLLLSSSLTLPRPQQTEYIMFDEECCLQCGKPMRHDK